jgi:hypothetical protein
MPPARRDYYWENVCEGDPFGRNRGGASDASALTFPSALTADKCVGFWNSYSWVCTFCAHRIQ